jgi:hypothetical protein|tara:strand:+ start:19 stop:1065 length:1047 start_codon:yes stop_codon:yes gene_type:complete
MAITYHAGRRIQGTAADFAGTPAVSGGWKELGRTTLGSTADIITVSSLADKRYLMCLFDSQNSGGVANLTRLGAGSVDSGSNYAYRPSSNGGADSTSTSVSYMNLLFQDGSYDAFGVQYIANLASKEKLLIEHGVRQQAAGAATAPGRNEAVGKWVNTSSALDTVSHYNIDTGSYNTGTEVVVLGWDDSDTHTTNFWEELDDSSWSTGDSWTSGTFTAKKYLWVQFYTEGGAGSSYFRFNGDSGTNYANRYSINGGADSTITGQPESYLGAIDGLSFHNLLIINNASNEKLFKHNRVSRSTAGASNSPKRMESVGKWANTSNQITSITVTTAGGGNFTAGNMKVWGSD